jgi:hypothetical protein
VSDIDNQWAWSQVEAMADRSLDAASARRMRAAMAKDGELRKAVERAATLRYELARLGRLPVPSGQRRRLLSIASRTGAASPVGRAVWRTLPIAVATVAVGAIGLSALLHRLAPPAPPAPTAPTAPTAQDRAVSEFETAMTYLHRSAVVAASEVSTAVGGGLRDAVAVSRDAIHQKKHEPKNGG